MPRSKAAADQQDAGGHIVAVEFKDAPEYRTPGEEVNTYQVGDDVSHLDAARLESLVQRGFVTPPPSE